ncbi:MAG: fatty acyl-AMP ligase [bacterium]|nr:fatty acyl-AMP ligase [bacterium]
MISSTHTTTLISLLAERAGADPHKLIYSHLPDHPSRAPSDCTRGELLLRAASIARRLGEICEPGDRALIIYPIGLEYLCAFFACLLARVVAVPVYPPRAHKRIPDSSLPRLRAIMRDCRPRIALSESETLERMGQMRLPESAGIEFIDTARIEDDPGSLPWKDFPRPEQPAFLQYTSGSTAMPRGVQITHANLLHNQQVIRDNYGFHQELRGLGWLPLYHDMGLIGHILQPLFNGGCTYFMNPAAFLKNPLRWLEEITRYRATTAATPPFGLRLVIEAAREADSLEQIDLSSWRHLLVGAEPIDARVLREFSESFEAYGFSPSIYYPCYGLAEATLSVSGGKTTDSFRSFQARRDELAEMRWAAAGTDFIGASVELVASGAVHSDFDLRIVDPETRRPRAADEIGEIWIAGASIASGYFDRAADNREVFGARLAGDESSPAAPEYLRTGDLGIVHDGELFVTGRIKELLIVGGRNHHLPDIESNIRSMNFWADRTIAAFVVRGADTEELGIAIEWGRHAPEPEAVAGEVAAAIAGIARVFYLSVYDFVLLKAGSIPRTSSGKIQRGLCSRYYEQTWPGLVFYSSRAERGPIDE